MPIGKVISGKMVKLKDGEYGIEIKQELFDKYQFLVMIRVKNGIFRKAKEIFARLQILKPRIFITT